MTRMQTDTSTDHPDRLSGVPDSKPVPMAELRRTDPERLRVWCHRNAICQVPTTELINYLKSHITDPARTLEIGTGVDHIGQAPGIPTVDNKMPSWPAEVAQ